MLRMGSVAIIAGLVITIVSTLFHASSEDLMDNPVAFEVYLEDDHWNAPPTWAIWRCNVGFY